MPALPPENDLTICFAHAAYQLQAEFNARGRSARSFEVRSLDELKARAAEADVMVVSGMWRNELIAQCPKLRFVQSVSAGTDQYDKAAFAAAGIRLASAQGANERAVSEHAMALILSLTRQIHLARDNQMAQPLAADDRRSRPTRGRTGRQDAGDYRPRPDRLAIGGAGLGLRHACHRRAPQPGKAAPCRSRWCGPTSFWR